ncbi:thermopsin family protease [Sulfuracidifex tepidarius]|nr:thermopsin family protease [Sulfuracidifex tepidarius]
MSCSIKLNKLFLLSLMLVSVIPIFSHLDYAQTQASNDPYEYALPQGGFEYIEVQTNQTSAVVYASLSNVSVTVDLMTQNQFMLFNTTGSQHYLYQQNSSVVLNAALLNSGVYYLVIYSPYQPVGFNLTSQVIPLSLVNSTQFAEEEVQVPAHGYTSILLHLSTEGSPFSLLLEGLSNQSVYFSLWNGSTVFNSTPVTATLNFTSLTFGYNLHLSPGVYYLNITNPHSSTATAFFYYKITPSYVNPYLTDLTRVPGQLPMGIASYGVVNSSRITTYALNFSEVAGYFNFSSLSAYNPNGSSFNVSDYSSSLQLNAVLYDNGSVYWPQDVLMFITNYSVVILHDNVFNMTTDNATLTNSSITSPEGFVTGTGHNAYYGNYKNPIALSYKFPFAGYLLMKVVNRNSGPVVSFGLLVFENGSPVREMFWFDNVSIRAPSDASFVVNGTEYTPAGIFYPLGSFYDAELVLGGGANGENTNFTSLKGELGLFYVKGGNLVAFPSYYTFGADTAESTSNVHVTDNGVVYVSEGKLNPSPLSSINVDDYPPLSYNPPAPVKEPNTSSATSTISQSSVEPTSSTQPAVGTASSTLSSSQSTSQSGSSSLTDLGAIVGVSLVVTVILGVIIERRRKRS